MLRLLFLVNVVCGLPALSFDRQYISKQLHRVAYYVTFEFNSFSDPFDELKAWNSKYHYGNISKTEYFARVSEFHGNNLSFLQKLLLANGSEVDLDQLKSRVLFDYHQFQDSDEYSGVIGFPDDLVFGRFTILPSFSRKPSLTSEQLATMVADAIAANGILTSILGAYSDSTLLTAGTEILPPFENHGVRFSIMYDNPVDYDRFLYRMYALFLLHQPMERERLVMFKAEPSGTNYKTFTFFVAHGASPMIGKIAQFISLRQKDILRYLRFPSGISTPTASPTELYLAPAEQQTVSVDTLAGRFGVNIQTNASVSQLVQRITVDKIRKELRRIELERNITFPIDYNRVKLHKFRFLKELANNNRIIYFSSQINLPYYSSKSGYLSDKTDQYINYFVADIYMGKLNELFPGEDKQLLSIQWLGVTISTSSLVKIPARLKQICNGIGYCAIENAACLDDGTNTGTFRCQCSLGFRATAENSCVRPLMISEDSSCKLCEQNKGFCYDSAFNKTETQCHCPVTRASDFLGSRGVCSLNYLNITCTERFMHVCFKPFDFAKGHQFAYFPENIKPGCSRPSPTGSTSKASFFTSNREGVCDCDPQPVSSDTNNNCLPGEYSLNLDLHDNRRHVCGTTKIRTSQNVVRYKNLLGVRTVAGYETYFEVFCDFETKVHLRNDVIDTFSEVDGETGSFEKAHVKMTLRNRLGDVITPGSQVALGEEVKIEIKMFDKNENFQAIKVDACTASSSADLLTSNAHHVALLLHGCPVPGQSHLTAKNLFQRNANDPTELINSPNGIKVFTLANKNTLFFHCTVEICQSINDCAFAECSSSMGPAVPSMGRRKRSSSRKTINLHQGIVVVSPRQQIFNLPGQTASIQDSDDPSHSTEQLVFPFTLGTICLIAIVIIAIAVIQACRLFRSSSETFRKGPDIALA